MDARCKGLTLTPLAAVTAGLVAGAVGTACLDAVHYLKYRRAGGTDGPLAWEFAPVENWEQAPDPGKVAKRLFEGFTQRELPDRFAWVTSTAAHWAFGSTMGAAYGVLVGSLRQPRPAYGVPFGAAVFANDYIALPIAGLYKPIWQYGAKVLAWDFGAHLAFGAGTGIAFRALARVASTVTVAPAAVPSAATGERRAGRASRLRFPGVAVTIAKR